jgi:hypothetical protein
MTLRFLSQGIDASPHFMCRMLCLAVGSTGARQIRINLGALCVSPSVVVLVLSYGFVGAAQLIMRTL